MYKRVMTLTRHIIEKQHKYPDATGALTTLLYQLILGCKIVNSKVNMAGLANMLGSTGTVNVQGEEVQKLDDFADFVLFNALDHTGYVAGMASEERDEIVPIRKQHYGGKYVIMLDPLDGSSNIDVNVSIGTIFSIRERVTPEGTMPTQEDFLQDGESIICAGYVLYGSSTICVYSAGEGVHGFTLDPSMGEFLLSHPDMRIPDRCKCLSINESYEKQWHKWTVEYMKWFKETRGFDGKITSRYIGSLVSDFHRNLLYGGVYLYPADQKTPNGKLRLLFENQPMAFLAKNAGGYASTGVEDTLKTKPTKLHQRAPLIVGNIREVEEAEEYYQKYGI